MNKLPKTIYVDEENGEPMWFPSAEECAVTGETRILGVYKLVGKVEVSTQIKQETVVKKSPRKAGPQAPAAAPTSESEMVTAYSTEEVMG